MTSEIWLRFILENQLEVSHYLKGMQIRKIIQRLPSLIFSQEPHCTVLLATLSLMDVRIWYKA